MRSRRPVFVLLAASLLLGGGALVGRAWRAPVRPARVLFAGCAEVHAGRVCELGAARALRVWVEAKEGARVTVQVDGHPVATTKRRAEEGELVTLDVADGARELTVEVADIAGTRRAAIALGARKRVWLDEVRALRRDRKLDAASARLAPFLTSADAGERALAVGMAARLELSRGHVEAAIAGLRRAIALAREAGLVSTAAEDTNALAFTLARQTHRYDEARAALEGAADLAVLADEVGARVPYYRGIVAMETGDARTALREFRSAIEECARLAIDDGVAHAENTLALTLELVGRWSEALALLQRLRARAGSASACERADVATNVALGITLVRAARCDADDRCAEAGVPPWNDALVAAREARALANECPNAETRASAATTLAETALAARRIDEATEALADARKISAEPDGTVRLAWLDLDARLALGRGDTKSALDAFERERALAAAALLGAEEWRAETGRGDALLAVARLPEAERAFSNAEALVASESLRVPLGEGRARFLADREASARGLVETLVRAGRLADAFRAARRSIARVEGGALVRARLASLAPDARERWDRAIGDYTRDRARLDELAADDWKLAGDELDRARTRRAAEASKARASLDAALAVLPRDTELERPLAAGEVALLAFPLAAGFVAFDADALAVRATRLDAALRGPREIVDAMLAVAAPRLAAARRVRVITHPRLAAVDVHAAEFRGAPLVAHAAVTYALEGAGAPVATSTRRAVVIADPTRDLASARDEGAFVAHALATRFDVTLLGGEAASASAIRAAAPGAAIFHYAGHAFVAGRDGWESAMPLASGATLTVGDVLAWPSTPAFVVLSSCEAARVDGDAGGLSLAHAFVLGGTAAVIAPSRVIDDALAAETMRELYRALTERSDSGEALRAAQLEIRRRHPASDWAAFRALGD